MTKVRAYILRKIAREAGADLAKLVREFRGMSATQIAKAVS